jgi:hypothetical protein
MSHLRGIQTAIAKAAGTYKKDDIRFIWGQVKDYDENKQTCTVIGEQDVEIPDVALSAGVCDGLVILPAKESTVVIAETIHSPVRFVILYSDIDKILLQVGDSGLTIWNSAQNGKQEIQFNDGSYGGLIQIQPLVDKLNALEKSLNDLIDSFNQHTHSVGGVMGGIASVTSLVPSSLNTGKINPTTQKSDLENPLITHGK